MLDSEDVRIDVYRAGRSFPRVIATHIPTGLSVAVDESPSQFRNRADALARLGEMVAEAPDERQLSEKTAQRSVVL